MTISPLPVAQGTGGLSHRQKEAPPFMWSGTDGASASGVGETKTRRAIIAHTRLAIGKRRVLAPSSESTTCWSNQHSLRCGPRDESEDWGRAHPSNCMHFLRSLFC
jgi:hypothetical protein